MSRSIEDLITAEDCVATIGVTTSFNAQLVDDIDRPLSQGFHLVIHVDDMEKSDRCVICELYEKVDVAIVVEVAAKYRSED